MGTPPLPCQELFPRPGGARGPQTMCGPLQVCEESLGFGGTSSGHSKAGSPPVSLCPRVQIASSPGRQWAATETSQPTGGTCGRHRAADQGRDQLRALGLGSCANLLSRPQPHRQGRLLPPGHGSREESQAGLAQAGRVTRLSAWAAPLPPHYTLLQGRRRPGLLVEGLKDAGRPRKPVRGARGMVHPQGSEAGVPAGCGLRLCGPGTPVCSGRQLWHTLSVQGHRERRALASSLATGSPAPRSPR